MARVDGILTGKQTRTILTAIRSAVNQDVQMDVRKAKAATTQTLSLI